MNNTKIFKMQKLIVNITQKNFDLLERDDLGCFILPQSLELDFKKSFIQKAQKKRKLCLLSGENAADEYLNIGADGIILDLSKEENPQKIIKGFKQKNPNALVGVISRNRRHEAMLISECEPDFIIFKIWADGMEKSKELLEWYGEFFLIQSAIMPIDGCSFDNISADFVIKSDLEI